MYLLKLTNLHLRISAGLNLYNKNHQKEAVFRDLQFCFRIRPAHKRIMLNCFHLFSSCFHCRFSLLLCRRSCQPLPRSPFLGLSICDPQSFGRQVSVQARTGNVSTPFLVHACMLDISLQHAPQPGNNTEAQGQRKRHTRQPKNTQRSRVKQYMKVVV